MIFFDTMKKNNYIEVRNDFTDDDGFTHIDVYLDEELDEEAKTVAIVCQDTGKVFFINRDFYYDRAVLQAIEEVKPKKKSEPDDAFRKLKEQANEFKNTLLLYLFEVVRLEGVIEDAEDFYWVFERANGQIVHVSCLIQWVPLKSYLKKEQYSRLKTIWNLNSHNKCN